MKGNCSSKGVTFLRMDATDSIVAEMADACHTNGLSIYLTGLHIFEFVEIICAKYYEYCVSMLKANTFFRTQKHPCSLLHPATIL